MSLERESLRDETVTDALLRSVGDFGVFVDAPVFVGLFMATNVKVLPAEKGTQSPVKRSGTQHFQYVWADKKMTRDEAEEIQKEAKEAKKCV